MHFECFVPLDVILNDGSVLIQLKITFNSYLIRLDMLKFSELLTVVRAYLLCLNASEHKNNKVQLVLYNKMS